MGEIGRHERAVAGSIGSAPEAAARSDLNAVGGCRWFTPRMEAYQRTGARHPPAGASDLLNRLTNPRSVFLRIVTGKRSDPGD